MKKEEKKTCYICGEELGENFIEHEGQFYCEICFDENFFYCEDCGELFEKSYMNYLENYEKCVCDNCLEDNYVKCEDCGDYINTNEEDHYVINNGHGDYFDVCNSCGSDYYYCEDCGDYFDEDHINYVDGSYYCNDCVNDHREDIYDYHDFNDWKLFKGKNEDYPPFYIGKEIEIEPVRCGNRSKEIVNAIYENINAVPMHDSSLDCGGVEVVTHPESWKYLQENKEKYVKFFDKIQEIGYGNNGSCGLHFHITRPNDEVTARVIVLLESFKEEIKKLSRRREGSLNHWAKFLSDNVDSGKEKIKFQSKKYLKEKYINSYHDRYFALNLCNSSTIEFRFFNGVDNFEEFWGALQFINNLMTIAMDENREINTITWKELIKGEELEEQAKKQGVLNIDKKAKDTTEIMEKYEEIVNKTKKEIKRILGNLAKYVNKEMTELDLKRIKENNVPNIYNKCDDFMRDFKYRMNYLERIINLYNALDNDTNNTIEIETIKEYWETTKSSYPVNTKRYKRYDNQMKKAFEEIEKEEI